MINVGKNIREAREKVGMTRSELAEKAGTTQRQIIRYEIGEQDITVGRLTRIAEALGVFEAELVK